MATLLREDEATPASWPAVAGHFPTRDAETGDDDNPSVDPAVTWRRIEEWTAHRWTPRSVTWIVQGPGEFTPRLRPFTLATVESFDDAAGDWTAATAAPTALGGLMLDAAIYRISGAAGDGSTPPEAVLEAWRRLHEYSLGIARQWWGEAAIYRSEDRQAPAGWAAKAIHLSGAADLLRSYRRLG